MNILIIGAGAREHALAWKMAQSHHCDEIYTAPGNAGTLEFGTNLKIPITNFKIVKDVCLEYNIQMMVVGPEEPLVMGIYDFFRNDPELQHIIVVAPSAEAAQLEGSKAFSKKFMARHHIPTADYAEFTDDLYEEGKKYISQHSLPVVLKADGLAAGKGVVIAASHEEALLAFEAMIVHKQFGDAGSKVVIEEFLQGIEVSVFVLTDGESYQVIGHAKDYKRIGEGDTGLNTGGMGCVSPVPFMDAAFMQKVEEKIIRPTVEGLAKENLDYHGFIFFGLMNVLGEPWLIEYNCRMGDPETEVVMPLLQTDLVALFAAMDNGTLADTNIAFSEQSCATVMAVSGGYPGKYTTGLPIKGLKGAETGDSIIFHAGTQIEASQIKTSGGRIIAVTSFGKNITEAVAKSKKILERISFKGMYYRGDIGYEFRE